jgi:hypothetical protein
MHARLYQANELFWSISISLSYAFIASSDLFILDRATPLLFQASKYSGLISIALSYAFIASSD